MRLRSLVVLGAAVLLPACGGGTHIEGGELARIMPSAADAPATTQIDTESVGPKTLEELVTDESVKAELKKLRFRGAYVAQFLTPNFIPDAEKAPLGSALYATSAIVFEDADDAHRGFDFYDERLRKRANDFTPLLIKKIGEELLAFRFSSLDDTPLPGIAIQWRRGNALFSVVGVGNPGPLPDVVRALARKLDDRALKA